MTVDLDHPTRRPQACRACPWRDENHGKRHPSGWYTAANRRRLWGGLRRGEGMSCHPTDPNNPVTEADVAAGYRPAPDESQVRECIGAIILVQREFMAFQNGHDGDIKAYRKARPGGLTLNGLLEVVSRAAFGGVPMIGGRPMPLPDISPAAGVSRG